MECRSKCALAALETCERGSPPRADGRNTGKRADQFHVALRPPVASKRRLRERERQRIMPRVVDRDPAGRRNVGEGSAAARKRAAGAGQSCCVCRPTDPRSIEDAPNCTRVAVKARPVTGRGEAPKRARKPTQYDVHRDPPLEQSRRFVTRIGAEPRESHAQIARFRLIAQPRLKRPADLGARLLRKIGRYDQPTRLRACTTAGHGQEEESC